MWIDNSNYQICIGTMTYPHTYPIWQMTGHWTGFLTSISPKRKIELVLLCGKVSHHENLYGIRQKVCIPFKLCFCGDMLPCMMYTLLWGLLYFSEIIRKQKRKSSTWCTKFVISMQISEPATFTSLSPNTAQLCWLS